MDRNTESLTVDSFHKNVKIREAEVDFGISKNSSEKEEALETLRRCLDCATATNSGENFSFT